MPTNTILPTNTPTQLVCTSVPCTILTNPSSVVPLLAVLARSTDLVAAASAVAEDIVEHLANSKYRER
jgi:hypothetical protein